jgi:RNA polymerase sigma-70 factor (ECF subfamily)
MLSCFYGCGKIISERGNIYHLPETIQETTNQLLEKETERRFEQQVKAHELMIHKICRMYAYTAADREDLFQDIVVQLWQAFPTFRGEAKFSTWLYRVAINTAMTRARKKKASVSYVDPDVIPTNQGEDASAQVEIEKLQILHEAISRLNEVERAVLMLYLEERSYEEMEEVLGMTQNALRVKISRIKDKLRQIAMNKSYGDR